MFPNLLLEPPILHTWTIENHQPPNTVISKFSSQVSLHTYTHQSTRTSRLLRPDRGMRPRNGGGPDERPLPLKAPNIPERPHPPPKLAIHYVETYIPLLPVSATFKLPHIVSPPTNTSRQTGATHKRCGMRLRAERGPGALPHPHGDRQLITPKATSQAKTHGRGITNSGIQQNSERRSGEGGSAVQAHCPILTGRTRPSVRTTRHIECTTRALIPTTSPAPPYACPHRDTRKDLTCIRRSLIRTGTPTIGLTPSPSSSQDAPRQPLTEHIGPPYPSRRTSHRITPYHPHTPQDHTNSHITATANLVPPRYPRTRPPILNTY